MALFDEAKAKPDVPLVEISPFVEVDLSLIIKSYEESMRESGTEEGVIVSGYGEIEKNKGALGLLDNINGSYSQSPSEDSAGGSAEVTIDTQLDLGDAGIPFGDCFPCDGRIVFGVDNLPHPAMFKFWETYLDAIEAFIQQMMNLMNPMNFYSDICFLLDALRIVCPQDLLVLLAVLRFLLAHYIMLSFQFNLDWIAIIGLLLLPILMLIHTLLQMAINIGLGPLKCLIEMLTFFYELNVSLEATVMQAADAIDTTVNSFEEVGRQLDSLGGGATDAEVPTTDTSEDFEEEPEEPSVPVPPAGGYQKYKEFIGKVGAFTSMLIAMTDAKFTLEELLAKFTRAVEVLINYLSAGMLLKMQLMGAIIDLMRLIGFLVGLIRALMNGSVCDDPSQPLSPSDVEGLVKALNASQQTASQSTTSSTDNPLVASTIGLDFNTATGELVITDKITDQSKRVPTCISKASADDRDTILEWIDELEGSS